MKSLLALHRSVSALTDLILVCDRLLSEQQTLEVFTASAVNPGWWITAHYIFKTQNISHFWGCFTLTSASDHIYLQLHVITICLCWFMIVYIYAFFPTCCVACMHALPAVLTQDSVCKECNQSSWLKKTNKQMCQIYVYILVQIFLVERRTQYTLSPGSKTLCSSFLTIQNSKKKTDRFGKCYNTISNQVTCETKHMRNSFLEHNFTNWHKTALCSHPQFKTHDFSVLLIEQNLSSKVHLELENSHKGLTQIN